MPNFSLNFDEVVSGFNNRYAVIDEASGFLGIGANMTGSFDYIEYVFIYGIRVLEHLFTGCALKIFQMCVSTSVVIM